MSGLPRRWTEAKISDLCDLINGKAFKPTDWSTSGLPIVRIQNLNNPDAGFNFFDGGVEEKFLIKNGQLLFAWSGTPGTSFGAHVWNGEEAVLNQHIFKVNFPTGLLDKQFLKQAINQKLDELIGKAHGGAGLQHVTKGKFEETIVSMPPLAEQKRIVAKLHTLNAKSSRARTELTRIETLVSRYKQAVLSKAFSGELSRSDARFGEFIHTAGNGLSKREGVEGEWTNVLRLTDLNQGQFSPTEPRQIRLTDNEVEKYRLAKGDVVIIRVNGSANLVGRSFCFKNDAQWAFCDHFIRVRLKPRFDPNFAALFLNSPPIRSIIEHKFVSTSGQKTISQKTLEELPAPQMSLDEQHEIIRRIESAFAKIDRLAAEARRALELVGRLDEAILAKAFRGELVPQDENDEPAEKLLERIRAERAAAPKAKRGRGGGRLDDDAM
ncbi:restriction endonuclease subunit S [Rhizobium leguminosarum]|uniref:restriction endonuclease subunit S n=1 Tax=Rhizobium leguminosarum TaxID=384 RepID=UPI000426398B|nr:restriction endonuclease subunit S [Rhizobium leguminosarum]